MIAGRSLLTARRVGALPTGAWVETSRRASWPARIWGSRSARARGRLRGVKSGAPQGLFANTR